MSSDKKKVCRALNYMEHFLNLVFVVTGCISISAFASLVDISTGTMSSTIGLNYFVIAARIKQYKSIVKKKKHEILLLAKTKLNIIKGLISRFLIDSLCLMTFF